MTDTLNERMLPASNYKETMLYTEVDKRRFTVVGETQFIFVVL